MKTLFIIPMVLMSLVSSPSWGLTMDDLVERDGLYYQKFIDVPFTGEIDEETIKGKYINGKKEGSWIIYYDNGVLHSKGMYKDDSKDGVWVGYWNNGTLDHKGNWENGKKNGSWTQYHSNGKLWSKGNYINGKRVGQWVGYWEKGQLSFKGLYINGLKEGLVMYYNRDGTVDAQNAGTYKNDVKVSD